MKNQKKYKEKGPTPEKMKAMKLTSHAAAMDLMVQFPSDRVIPRERFSPRSQLFMGTASKQRTKTLVAHRQMMKNLQHVDENRNGYGEQNQ